MLHRTIAATLMLLTPAFASASTQAPNPFASIDIVHVLGDCADVRAGKRFFTLKRTGDTTSLDDIAMQKISGPIGDGRYFLVIPFHNAARAEHSAIVFASDGTTTYEVGGFAAKGDHFVMSYSDAIDVTLYDRPSDGKTVPEGGPAPVGIKRIVVSGRHLASAPRRTTSPAIGMAAP